MTTTEKIESWNKYIQAEKRKIAAGKVVPITLFKKGSAS